MSNSNSRDTFPSVNDIDRIAFNADPVLRNLQITQCYSDLSAIMPRRTGLSANWCTYATWASRQAGRTIRKEDLVRALEAFLGESSEATRALSALASTVQQLAASLNPSRSREFILEVLNPARAFDRSSDAVARGNKKVFEEIGREFARFYASCLNDSLYDEHHIQEFCQGLRPGEPPDGQGHLRQAFSAYYRAFFEGDPKTRAELILLGNLEIGYHEQTRLQSEIAEALNAPVADPPEVSDRLMQAILPSLSWLGRTRMWLRHILGGKTPLDHAVDAVVDIMRKQVRRLLTETMMTLALPEGLTLRLGKDLQSPFPESLQHIVTPELQVLLHRIDPTPDSVAASGADDWADLPDRLHFIVDLFRCYQEWPDLFDPPFSAEQVEAIGNGQRPAGNL